MAQQSWYPDPGNPDQLRWWDGTRWTEHVQPMPRESGEEAQTRALAIPAFGQQGVDARTRRGRRRDTAADVRTATGEEKPRRRRRWLAPLLFACGFLLGLMLGAAALSDDALMAQNSELRASLEEVTADEEAAQVELETALADLSTTTEELAASGDSLEETTGDLESALADVADLQAEIEAKDAELASATTELEALTSEQGAVQAREDALARQEADLASREAAVAEAEAASGAAQSSSGGSQSSSGGNSTSSQAPAGSGSDPRFSTCAEAKRNGYGPYRVGSTEYGWYQDRDNDGIVCE